MALSTANRVVGANESNLEFGDTSLLDLAERFSGGLTAIDPVRVAEMYSVPVVLGGYTIEDAEALASYFRNSRRMTEAERARLEESIVAEGSVFDRVR